MNKVKIEVDVCAATFTQAVMESVVVAGIVSSGECGEVRSFFLIPDLEHSFESYAPLSALKLRFQNGISSSVISADPAGTGCC